MTTPHRSRRPAHHVIHGRIRGGHGVTRLTPAIFAIALAAGGVFLGGIAFATLGQHGILTASSDQIGSPSQDTPFTVSNARSTKDAVCGKGILRSPYNYDGRPGRYFSGKAGLPTFGRRGSDFPRATAGYVLSAVKRDYASYQLSPRAVYYLLPGTHVGSFEANYGDVFVGGLAHGKRSVLSGDYRAGEPEAIDSNSTLGDQPNVTIEYLTIEKFTPGTNAAAINQDTNLAWTIKYNTVTLNVPGAGIFAGSDNAIEYNCLTLNGQYGFQSAVVDSWGHDKLTDGPYNIKVAHNEISYNDTCDYEGRLDNSAIGWKNYDPVPRRDRNPHCGTVVPNGDEGGFKLWQTDGVTIKDNDIHGNWGPGAWVDTDNANTTFNGNAFISNEGPAIIEEISYNFSITGNYLADNDLTDGLANSGFPQAAIYVANSGSDTRLGAVPSCPEAGCKDQGSYSRRSVISWNTMVNNGGSVFIFQDSNRYCSDGSDGICTLVDGGMRGPFSLSSCAANLPSASVNTRTYVGNRTGSPPEDWWDGCQWEAANISITHNVIDFDPAQIKDCNERDWSDCGATGLFSEYGSPPNKEPGWVVATQLTFFQHDVWADNTYNGPTTFYAWNQGNGDNPVTWAEWTRRVTRGDKCSSSGERQSGYCTGPFGQDAGSKYRR
jgi:parallel beta-helix repeat protein